MAKSGKNSDISVLSLSCSPKMNSISSWLRRKKYTSYLICITATSLIFCLTTENKFHQFAKQQELIFNNFPFWTGSIEALLEEYNTTDRVYLSNPDAYKYSENRKYVATSQTDLNCKQRPLNLKDRKGTVNTDV